MEEVKLCCITKFILLAICFNIIGNLRLSGGMNFTLNSDNQFTLTCVSTGGPATTVIWTRNPYYYSTSATVTEGTDTILYDTLAAQYNHTLTVTGRIFGTYTCTVANDISRVMTSKVVRGETGCTTIKHF